MPTPSKTKYNTNLNSNDGLYYTTKQMNAMIQAGTWPGAPAPAAAAAAPTPPATPAATTKPVIPPTIPVPPAPPVSSARPFVPVAAPLALAAERARAAAERKRIDDTRAYQARESIRESQAKRVPATDAGATLGNAVNLGGMGRKKSGRSVHFLNSRLSGRGYQLMPNDNARVKILVRH